ncbi:hypothetical protein LCGC14_1668280 [marine sediment metagenome]|uniref:Uncharacterized protein n=1 Tax=marine sediment metagenome TaxID=412755 RepID=A0A0F9KS33_9ZZZZ
MRKYRQARTDYPDEVLGIYDNGGTTIDRYTIVFTPFECDGCTFFPFLDMSGAPYHPQGVCLHGETEGYRITGGWGTGQKVISFNVLPTDCQRAVREDLEGYSL